MTCDPTHGPAVATVQVVAPYLSGKDEVCEKCLRWFEDWADRNRSVELSIELLSTEAGWTESVASAVLLLGFLGLFIVAMGAI